MRVKHLQAGDGCPLAFASQRDYFHARGWTVDPVRVDGPTGASLRERLFAYERAAQDRQLRSTLAAPADLFFTNDVGASSLTAYLPAGCKRVLATSGPPVSQSQDDLAASRDALLLNIERDLYHLFDAVLVPRKADGIPNAFHVPPLAPAPSVGPNYDLLIEASNESSAIDWFYRNVFVPYLWKHDVCLVIAGPVSERLGIHDANVTLAEGKAASGRIVVVPVFADSAYCAATLSGLANGRAVLTTPAGARGFEDSGLLTVDMKSDPAGTAALLLDLLASPARRQELERLAAAYVRLHHSREVYFAALDRALAA